jgi:hypothetical protein
VLRVFLQGLTSMTTNLNQQNKKVHIYINNIDNETLKYLLDNKSFPYIKPHPLQDLAKKNPLIGLIPDELLMCMRHKHPPQYLLMLTFTTHLYIQQIIFMHIHSVKVVIHICLYHLRILTMSLLG